MHHSAGRHTARLFAVIAAAALSFALQTPTALAGKDDNVSGFIWSGTIGWVSLNCTDFMSADDKSAGKDCADVGLENYGVTFLDETKNSAWLKGWAWSETAGWICFGKTCAERHPGIKTPDEQDPVAKWERVKNNGGVDKFGQIWGWALVDNLVGDLGDPVDSTNVRGWISLNCGNSNECATSNYYTYLDVGLGQFIEKDGTGTPITNSHFAWSGNKDGTGIGWVEFGLYASTTWAPSRIGVIIRPKGVYEPPAVQSCTLDSDCAMSSVKTCCLDAVICGSNLNKCSYQRPYRSSLKIGFRNFSGTAGNLVECQLTWPNAQTRLVNDVLLPSPPGPSLRNPPGRYSLTYDFQPADYIDEDNDSWKPWRLDYCLEASAPLKDQAIPVCAVDADCPTSDPTLDYICDWEHRPTALDRVNRCRLIIDKVVADAPVYTHENAWKAADQAAAQSCFEKQADRYFANDGQRRCDLAGDVAFAMLMRRSFPVEGACDDETALDDDGDTDSNARDRNCRGIVYAPDRCLLGDPNDELPDCNEFGFAFGANNQPCCNSQPADPTDLTRGQAVNGTSCGYGNPNDGYFDCDCAAAKFGVSQNDDCYAPGAQAGFMCCKDVEPGPDQIIKL